MTTQTRPELAVEYLDPRTLLADRNARTDLRIDPDFQESIRIQGVLEPVTAVRVPDGGVRIRTGHRRTAAAIIAGWEQIPVVIIGSEDQAREADRLVGQYHENHFRAPLTAAEDAAVVEQLLDLGLTAGDIATAIRMPAAAVDAARRVRASKVATAAAAAPEITLDMAAGIAEFDDDDQAVTALTNAASAGDGHFRHQLERMRQDRRADEIRDAMRADLEAKGITVVDDRPDWSQDLDNLRSSTGKKLTPASHEKCDGHVAWVNVQWMGGRDSQPKAYALYFCADPKANGHRKATGMTSGDIDLEAQRAERARVRAGNAAWRAARTVRREWLTGQLAAKTPPKGTQRFLAAAIFGHHIESPGFERHHKTARALLGLPEYAPTYDDPKPDPLTEAIDRASDGRALVIALAMAAGACEDQADDDTWRYPLTKPHIGRYLDKLTAWGYTLSDIEQAVAEGKPWQPGDAS